MRCSGRWMPGVSMNTIWPPVAVAHADDAGARRLRLVRDDRDLLADEPVQQRRLAGVRPADERDEAGLHDGRPSLWPPAPGARRTGVAAARAASTPARGARAGARRRAPPRRGRRSSSTSPDRRHAAEARQEVAADGLEALALRSRRRAARRASRCRPCPDTTNRPWPSSTIGSVSTSYSSRISPTISSSRSSRVTRPAVPPYSSTTMAICHCWRWNSRSRSDTRLVSGTTYAGRTSVETGRSGRLGLGQPHQVLDEHEPERCCRASRRRPGCASTPARGRTPAAPPSVASARIATMSGRGVITSRTSVSPKSTIDWSSCRSSRSMRPSCSPASR